MKRVNKGLLIVFLLVTSAGFSQSISEKLKKEQARLERNIADTKSLLSKSKTNTSTSLNELRVIKNQIRYRERLLKNYDDQIRSAELTVEGKEQQITELTKKVSLLKQQYKRLLIYAYKHRNKYGKAMYVFTADSYNDARKRNKYLERISELQQKQFLVIQQNQRLIKDQIVKIEDEKTYKLAVLTDKKIEREAIEKDKEKQEKVYQEFKKEEDALLAKLKEEERKRQNLKARINAAIRKEIAEAEARRKKAEAKALAAAKKAREAAAASKEITAPTPVAPIAVLKETKEAAALSQSFAGNKGKLPWPVDKGNVTEKFGKNPHPTLKNVYTNNRGIDISSMKNAQVRVVFEGEVTSVLSIPGAGKVVIIKHGDYRTVYSNLQDTYVKAGDKVNTKKVIGSLLTKDNLSIVHFEIHQVSGSQVTCLNPSLWVAH